MSIVPYPVDQTLSSEGTPDDEVSLVELAALRAGELSAEEEARLRMRMAGDPEVENKLWALDNVHRLFEVDLPRVPEFAGEMPYDVAARLQARIAQEALHRHEHALPDDGSHQPEDED